MANSWAGSGRQIFQAERGTLGEELRGKRFVSGLRGRQMDQQSRAEQSREEQRSRPGHLAEHRLGLVRIE